VAAEHKLFNRLEVGTYINLSHKEFICRCGSKQVFAPIMLPSIVLFAGLVNLVFCAALNDIRPLVIWHGLGDTYASSGMDRFQSEVKEMHPGIFIHSIFIDEDPNADQRASFVSIHTAIICVSY
jgi:hypothetical protein